MPIQSDIVGKWDMTEPDSDNFDAYMKEVGVGMLTRQAAKFLKPSVEFSVNGDEWTFATKSSLKNHEIKFKLDGPTNHTTADGREVTSVWKVENDHLTTTETGKNGKNSTFDRYIEDGKMHTICCIGTIKCHRVYNKAG